MARHTHPACTIATVVLHSQPASQRASPGQLTHRSPPLASTRSKEGWPGPPLGTPVLPHQCLHSTSAMAPSAPPGQAPTSVPSSVQSELIPSPSGGPPTGRVIPGRPFLGAAQHYPLSLTASSSAPAAPVPRNKGVTAWPGCFLLRSRQPRPGRSWDGRPWDGRSPGTGAQVVSSLPPQQVSGGHEVQL